MMKIILLSSIAPEAVDELGRNHDVKSAFDVPSSDLPELLQDREALILRSGVTLTADLGGDTSTADFGAAIIGRLERVPA